ncbi:MAG TPA: branched-chain amino acid ABC transporter permease [Chloroflexota bacterium]|nr:branched-chain amino acid ABC transporter permease [Chloroflexota bacterium]
MSLAPAPARLGADTPSARKEERTPQRRWPHRYIILTLLAAVLTLLPLIGSNYLLRYAILILQYVGLALSWNIISGYAGYVSFGHVAFFGLGAYTGAIVMRDLPGLPWPIAIGAGGLLCAAVAWPLGRILLSLRGPYFAIAMLGLAQVLRVIASAWQSFTGGGQGVSLPPQQNLSQVYWSMLFVAVAVLALTIKIDGSRFGLQLVAIREDEPAAEVLGVDTVRAKVHAFILSSIAPGVIGALYAWSISYIDPASAFRGHITITMITMTILGGAGTVWGPVIGAVTLSVVSEELWARSPEFYLATFGGIIMLIAMFLPRGVLPYLRHLARRHRRRAAPTGKREVVAPEKGTARA